MQVVLLPRAQFFLLATEIVLQGLFPGEAAACLCWLELKCVLKMAKVLLAMS